VVYILRFVLSGEVERGFGIDSLFISEKGEELPVLCDVCCMWLLGLCLWREPNLGERDCILKEILPIVNEHSISHSIKNS
jgi:hypothetical protein